MITGKIEQSRYPRILLELVTNKQKEKLEFLVDTGFDDEIALSYDYADLFDLELLQSIKVTYANGESIDEILALAKIIWFGEEQEVRVILSHDEKPSRVRARDHQTVWPSAI
jgi:predicted aspartyl protease